MDDEIDFEIQNKPKVSNKRELEKMGTIIIEDDDPNEYGCQQRFLEVKEDFGGIGSDSQNDSNNERNFEDELIRRTLTRKNYQNVKAKESKNENKQSSKTSKLKRTIYSVDQQDIKRSFERDFGRKKGEAMSLQNQIKYLENRLEEKGKTLRSKKALKEQMSTKFRDASRIL